MTETRTDFNGYSIRLISLNTVVVGSGASGFNAADRLWQYGQKDIAIVTEGINCGTSRNTGSDKQTYYKLSLSGEDPDSVLSLARVLFAGQCVDGDHALCEAALSAQSFLRLVELGVPFPRNRYGEFVGYKTDHDPNRRATSAGPYTSRIMTGCLERSVMEKRIKIFDGFQAVKILSEGEKLLGLLCVDLNAGSARDCFVLFNCVSVILATGGPAGIYSDSVFPAGHHGATGLALEAGAKGKNLTEWQFGIASVNPRWNVSGTYMQALPQFVSADRDGNDEKEFLSDFFADKNEMLSLVFLKGYQWPFDVRKVRGGSSVIDILVYIETELKGRRVFLDFRENPGGVRPGFASLSPEAREYLEKAGACFGTPVQRLRHMNAPAVSFYMDKGVDLEKERLEIALCAQHNNGGLDIDCWWQTNIKGLFAVGEAAASHGVYRPGGSALNAGQVGSTRAAQYIAEKRSSLPGETGRFMANINKQLLSSLALVSAGTGEAGNISRILSRAAKRMSRVGGAVRDSGEIRKACSELESEIRSITQSLKAQDHPRSIAQAFRLKETLICQYTYLSAMADYADRGGKSRGSALYTDVCGALPYDGLPEIFRFTPDDGRGSGRVQLVRYREGICNTQWRRVRDIPLEDDFFENVWRSFRENKNVY